MIFDMYDVVCEAVSQTEVLSSTDLKNYTECPNKRQHYNHINESYRIYNLLVIITVVASNLKINFKKLFIE